MNFKFNLPHIGFISALVVLTSLGCSDFGIKELDQYEVDQTPQLAMHTLLIPQDSLIYLELERTTPVGQQTRTLDPETAQATITDIVGGQSASFTFTDRYFTLPTSVFPLLPGREYLVEANTNDGLRASGSCKIPDLAPEDGEVELLFSAPEPGSSGLYVQVSTANQAGTDDYYALFYETLTWNEQTGQIRFRSRDLIDAVHGTNEFGVQVAFNEFYSIANTPEGELPQNRLLVCRTDRQFLQYQTSKRAYLSSSDNPFAEPVGIFSNLNEGLGNVSGLNCMEIYF